jgi:hypothetical protein
MDDQPKKPYVKPEVTQVALTPGEAVLGNCKMAGSSGPVSSTSCRPFAMNCRTQGS